MSLKKKLATFSIALSAAVIGFTGFQANASRLYTTTTYYSDDSYSQQVGTRVSACNGRVFTTGTVTTYRVVESEPCCGQYLC